MYTHYSIQSYSLNPNREKCMIRDKKNNAKKVKTTNSSSFNFLGLPKSKLSTMLFCRASKASTGLLHLLPSGCPLMPKPMGCPSAGPSRRDSSRFVRSTTLRGSTLREEGGP